MLGDVQDVYLGDVRSLHRRVKSAHPVGAGRAGGRGSAWRSVCRVDALLVDGGAATCLSVMLLFSVQAVSSAVAESRLMGAAGAAVDADGVLGERSVGSADVG